MAATDRRTFKLVHMEPLDINIIYNEIVEKLKVSNNEKAIVELERSASGAATGSEALMNQGSYLVELKNNDPAIFNLLERQINDYLKYCRQSGLTIG